MAHPKIAVGLAVPPKPPMPTVTALLYGARALRLDAFMLWDHLQDLFPQALWEPEFTWFATQAPRPHAFYDYQVVLGHLARRAGRLRLGVAVTEPVRRHPVVIAQAMLTLAHLTKRPPILGIGAGERMNLAPYGFDETRAVSRLEEALQVIRLCFDATEPIDFAGKHYQLDHAPFDLRPRKGKTPEIWVGALGPRMLRLTGQYGDAWYPLGLLTPDEYAAKLAEVHAAARAAGRDPAAITPALQPYLVVARTRQEARALLDTKLIRFVGLLAPADAWRKVGHEHPFGPTFRGQIDFLPERYTRAELDEAIALVPTELAEVGLIWGSVEEVVTQLRAYGEAGLRHVAPQFLSASISRRGALATLPALRAITNALRSGA